MVSEKILIIKNSIIECPGMIETILKEKSISFEIVELDKGQIFPNPKNYSAVIVLGGPDSANDSTTKMRHELEKIRETINAGIPYLGICLGMQALVKANGGSVMKNHIKEIGIRAPDGNFFEIEFTHEGKSDRLFHGLKPPLKIFHLHGETVGLADNMELLATGKFCKNQVVKVGINAYGIQGHFEMTEEMLELLMKEDDDLKKIDKELLRKDYMKTRQEYEANARRIFGNFLGIAGLE